MKFPTPVCRILVLLILQLSLSPVCLGFGFLAPVAVGVSSVVLGTICHFKECCSERGIPANFSGLEDALEKRLYGQHLVQDIVVNALRSHWDGAHKPQKALTLSFHGWPGSGKNYVTRFIVENMYAAGIKSNFVNQFIGRIHFPLQENVAQYQEDLYKWIKGNVTKCSKQLFIFDEVDKMPSQVLNVIKPMIDYREDVDGTDYRESVFIFLSNTGANLINEHFLDLWKKQGRKREDLKLKDFEMLISKGAFNEEGGFHHSDTIKSNLIDHYVPFLPMERRHIKLCIIDEFKERKVMNPQEEHINEAMEFIEWGPSAEKVFSTTGCKRISQKVGTIVSKYKLHIK
ncbi:Torsin and/or AAA 5 domain containing protein [Asbolus verrucosus]|uniref:Torsin and/or AAA 5 domain containing protein n=1 Tax=Asbolus verrucosus TaxID=1661398 RepID=A0A482W2L4_ASBVE|nr:Torsin and/or AAA 5 domain containing protein [Asbolus verrucosus]